MKRWLLAGSLAVLLHMTLAVPQPRADDEQVPSEKEVQQAEGMPPLMPHAMPKPGKNGQLTCLDCHETGKKGAPQTPHPERKLCTQCHVQGEARARKKKK